AGMRDVGELEFGIEPARPTGITDPGYNSLLADDKHRTFPSCIRTTSFSFPVQLKFPKKPGRHFRVHWLDIAAKIFGIFTARFIQSVRRCSAQSSRCFFPRRRRGE